MSRSRPRPGFHFRQMVNQRYPPDDDSSSENEEGIIKYFSYFNLFNHIYLYNIL